MGTKIVKVVGLYNFPKAFLIIIQFSEVVKKSVVK